MPRFSRFAAPVLVASLLFPSTSLADDFEAGSLIIPMDTDYQDEGTLRAFGLVYELLRSDIPIRWVIKEGKAYGDVDFTVSATDLAGGPDITGHGYRGGPWVIDSRDADRARPIIEAWQADYPETTAHEATEAFSGDVSRYLVVAPTIAMVADGNQNIARGYMQAAAIPDSIGNLDWPDDSPDMLDPLELAGPLTAATWAEEDNHANGALFDEDGDPVYCQLMSMHWGTKDSGAYDGKDNQCNFDPAALDTEGPEVVAEVRQFLNHPTHFFAECQAVNAFENQPTHGFFLTQNGFLIGEKADTGVTLLNMDSPYGQLDGPYEFGFNGSEPSYTLMDSACEPGGTYKAGDITMVTEASTPVGENDVWMTGYLDGTCPPTAHECGSIGKISYLGGHEYATDVPLSTSAQSQGTRLFLNALFEAPCSTLSGQPTLAIAVAAPVYTDEGTMVIRITYVNTGVVTALGGEVVLHLPPGTTIDSMSAGGVEGNGTITWNVGNLGPSESGDLEVVLILDEYGEYSTSADLTYRVGVNERTLSSNTDVTVYAEEPPDGLIDDVIDTGPGGASGGDGDGDVSGDGDASGDGDGTMSGDGDANSGGDGDGSGDGDAGDGASSSDEGGCGCRMAGSPGPGGPWTAFAMTALAAILVARRRGSPGSGRRRGAELASLTVVLGLAACSGDGNKAELDGAGDGDADAGGDGDGSGDGDDTMTDIDLMGDGDGDAGGDSGDGDRAGCEKIDFLFVIDSSESMKDYQANLAASFPGFVQAMEGAGKANGWQVMVVDTDSQWGGAACRNSCDSLGYCVDEPDFDCEQDPPELCDITIGAGEVAPSGESASNEDCGLDRGRRYTVPGQSDIESTFTCLATVGVDGSSEERQMDALVRALSPEMNEPGACNQGFLRDDAILVVTLITDEPDSYSDGTAQEWADALIEAKGENEEAIVLLGLIPDGDLDAPVCAEPKDAPRMADFLGKLPKSSRASVCEDDYSSFFQDAVDVISDTCDEFIPPVVR